MQRRSLNILYSLQPMPVSCRRTWSPRSRTAPTWCTATPACSPTPTRWSPPTRTWTSTARTPTTAPSPASRPSTRSSRCCWPSAETRTLRTRRNTMPCWNPNKRARRSWTPEWCWRSSTASTASTSPGSSPRSSQRRSALDGVIYLFTLFFELRVPELPLWSSGREAMLHHPEVPG